MDTAINSLTRPSRNACVMAVKIPPIRWPIPSKSRPLTKSKIACSAGAAPSAIPANKPPTRLLMIVSVSPMRSNARARSSNKAAVCALAASASRNPAMSRATCKNAPPPSRPNNFAATPAALVLSSCPSAPASASNCSTAPALRNCSKSSPSAQKTFSVRSPRISMPLMACCNCPSIGANEPAPNPATFSASSS